MEVRWFRSTFSSYVHLYHSGQDDYSSQPRQYQGRTQFSREGISVGNVSLRILKTRLSDEGRYQCLVADGNFYEEASLELQVAVSGSSPLLSVEDYQDGGIRVGCRATGWYPKPEMLWRDFQGQQLPSFTQSDSQDQDGFFQVDKSIVIQRNTKQNVSCSVRNTRLPQEKDSTIYISDSICPKDSSWTVAFFVTLAACLALLGVSSLFICRLRGWRNTIFPVEEVHVTLDADTAHPKLILSAGGKSVRPGRIWQALPDNPERYNTYRCVLGQEGFISGRCFWEVDVRMEEEAVWAMGVAKESTKRKGWINPTPEDGILALYHCDGKYWAMTSPDRTALVLNQRPRTIRVYLDFEGPKVAFLNADNKDELFAFPLDLLGRERIRPWFHVGPNGQLNLKSPPSPQCVPSVEEPLLPSSFPLRSLLTGGRTPRTLESRT
ncbi:butyrophilin subfamily 1 member A1-like [Morus bassanus]